MIEKKECVGVQNDRYAVWAVRVVEAEHLTYVFFILPHQPLHHSLPAPSEIIINCYYEKLAGIYSTIHFM